MKNFKKGFIWLVILMVVIIILAVVGVLYYMGQNSSLSSSNFIKDFFPQENKIVNNTQQKESCLVITSPVANQTISLPLNIEGYIDIVGAKADTCIKWGAFEGTAGEVVAKDVNGNVKSQVSKINTVGDYYTGMEKWPVKVTIKYLTGTPYSNEISLHMASSIGENPEIEVTKIIQPLIIESSVTLRKEGETCGEGIGSCEIGLECFYPCGVSGCQSTCVSGDPLPRP